MILARVLYREYMGARKYQIYFECWTYRNPTPTLTPNPNRNPNSNPNPNPNPNQINEKIQKETTLEIDQIT
jgi:hypothetical protein